MSEDDGPSIRALDDATIRQIAAGEVVERPASVVKELVENSLDAGASRVSVAVETGGTEGIRVRDDGAGMTEEEVRLSVQEHTTSKIRDIDDLDGGVGTLGFRGEALHTIGAVSRLTVRSKPQESTGAGTELVMEGGEVTDVRPVGSPAGTVVEVDDLFFNTPARRKFLKTTATEFDHINTVVTQYALANPDVAVSLDHDGREVFATEGRGSLESTVLSVYGREVAESMVPVELDDPTGSVARVAGLVSHPETTRSARDYLSTFVNDRYVTARVLREAVVDAYGGQLASDRYPFAVLFVDLPPETVDVNVHPRKMEVRFDDESGVKSTVERAVREALLDAGLVRSSAPRGRSAPTETQVTPESPATTDSGGNPSNRPKSSDSGAERAVDDESVAVDATETVTTTDDVAADTAVTGTPSNDADSADAPPGDATSPEQSAATADEAETPRSSSEPSSRDDTGGATDDGTASARQASLGGDGTVADETTGDETVADETDTSERSSPARAALPTTQHTLDGDEAAMAPAFDRLPPMRILGQLFDTYIVAESDDGLLLVDQHAADERVNYERLKAAVAGETPTQALAEAVELELTAREAALFEEYRDALAQVGFHAGRTGERTVEVRTVPAVFDATLDPNLLRDALTAFVTEEESGGRDTVDAVADDLLADLACYPSITGNTSLREGSVLDLLSALDDCDNPYACPHGRPVVIEFDHDEIEDRFERDYPGHAGRRDT